MQTSHGKGSFLGLFPLLVFIVTYLLTAILMNDFYKMPVLVAFVFSAIVGFAQYPKKPFEDKLAAFCQGGGNPIIILMLMIFLLAGAFAKLANHIGAIDSIINLSLTFISPSLFIAGLFLISAFVSTSIGTSLGTIVSLAPLAVGFNDSVPGTLALALAAVVGGAMFGDNLSFISDTTIAASKTQDVSLRDKFRVNIRIVILPAVVTFIVYAFMGNTAEGADFTLGPYSVLEIVPYLLVLVLAVSGLNVIWALLAGIFTSLAIGSVYKGIDFWEAIRVINEGFGTMFELSLICIVIGGLVGIVRFNGGIDYILYQVSRRIRSERGAELGIAGLTAVLDAAIANNTITIIIAGPIAKDIVDKYGLDPRRSASILDTIACTVQGCLPYGGQILAVMAISAYQISPFEVIGKLYYPMLVGISSLLVILLRKYFQPKTRSLRRLWTRNKRPA